MVFSKSAEEILAFDEIRCPDLVDLAHRPDDLLGGCAPDLEQVHDVFPRPGLGCRVPDAVSQLVRAVLPWNRLCHWPSPRGREVPQDQPIPTLFESTVKAPDWAFISWVRLRIRLKVTYDKKLLSQVIPFLLVLDGFRPFWGGMDLGGREMGDLSTAAMVRTDVTGMIYPEGEVLPPQPSRNRARCSRAAGPRHPPGRVPPG